jgi:hypothetical protein
LDGALVAAVCATAGALGIQLQDVAAESTSFWAVNRRLVEYWTACVEAGRGHGQFSYTPDKSRVFGHGTMNGMIVLPTNAAWWCFPQVWI